MSVRLLSFLSSIQASLVRQDGPVFEAKPVRTVNYRTGLARMTFPDGTGSIVVQNFHLANGVVCLKVALEWAHATTPEVISVYPQGDDYDWAAASDRIAERWLAGPSTLVSRPKPGTPEVSADMMAAVG